MNIHLFPAGSILAVMLWAAVSGPAGAADSTFNVDSYIPQKFTDFQLRIDGGLHLEGERAESKFSSEEGDYLGEQTDSYDVQEIRAALATNYRYETIPRYLNLSVSAAGYDYNYHGDRGYATDWTAHFKKGAQSSVDAGAYLVSDLFLSFTGAGTWDYGRVSSGDVTGHDRAYTANVALLSGWGRMYEGEYAATGMYIIDVLRHDGILEREPDYEEMVRLTEIIYRYRQTHAVDERLHKIEALTRIMEFLQEIQAINDTGPYGYLLIQDVWDYYPTFSRGFGCRLRVGGGMEYGYSSNDYTGERKVDGPTASHIYRHYRTSEKTPYVVNLFEWHRPFGLHWQMDVESEGRFYYDRHRSYEAVNIDYVNGSIQSLENTTEYAADWTRNIAATIRCIFDSRSNARATISFDRVHYDSRSTRQSVPTGGGGSSRSDQDEKSLQLAGIMEYRLAIPTIVTLEILYRHWSLESITSNKEDDEYRHYILTVGVTHYLF